MKKMLLSIATGIFCCYSATFGMEEAIEINKQQTGGAFFNNHPINFFKGDNDKLIDYELLMMSSSDEEPPVTDPNVIQTVKQWRKISSSLKQRKQRKETLYAIVKECVRKKNRIYDSYYDNFRGVLRKCFYNLKNAYGKIDLPRLFEKEDVTKDPLVLFPWLAAMQERLKNFGCFEILIGQEFDSVRQNRTFIQEKCDDMNEDMNDAKEKSKRLNFKQKLFFTARCEIVQEEIERIKRETAKKQSPLQGLLSYQDVKFLEHIIDDIEDDLERAKSILINDNNSDNIAKIAFDSQVEDIYKAVDDCEKKEGIGAMRGETQAIIYGQDTFLDKQKKISQLTNTCLLLKKSLEINKKGDKKQNFNEKELKSLAMEEAKDGKTLKQAIYNIKNKNNFKEEEKSI